MSQKNKPAKLRNELKVYIGFLQIQAAKIQRKKSRERDETTIAGYEAAIFCITKIQFDLEGLLNTKIPSGTPPAKSPPVA